MAIEVILKSFRNCILSILTVFFIPALSLASVGSVNALSGTSYYRAKGAQKWNIASKGQALDTGDSVKTGADGRMMLKFSDGSSVSIGNSSELEITEFLLKKKNRSAVFSLSTGKMRAAVSRFSGTTDIKVKTPTSVAGVKGTEFMVMNQGSANVLFGKENSVEVSGDDSKTVKLTPGKMTENTRGGSPIAPVTVEPGSPLDEARKELEAVTDVGAPVEWEKAGKLPDILARWNINYGHYAADAQRFKDALDVFQISMDLTQTPAIKAEALLERGTIFSRNLNEPHKALAEYMEVIEKYPEPPFIENAVYSAGMVNMELGEKDPALKLFKRYMRDFPEGSHRDTVEFFIGILERD